MKKLTEIRWHGRGGQGAKTASLLLADVAFSTGLYIQGFPEYGPERMGAPITAYNRLCNEPLRVHSNIYYPDYVAVVDETLLASVDVTAGLKKEGAIVINTAKNTPMLAAVVKASGVMSEEEFLGNMEASLKHKFASKPEVIESNMEALRISLKEVKLYER